MYQHQTGYIPAMRAGTRCHRWWMFAFSCALDQSDWWASYNVTAPCGWEQGVKRDQIRRNLAYPNMHAARQHTPSNFFLKLPIAAFLGNARSASHPPGIVRLASRVTPNQVPNSMRVYSVQAERCTTTVLCSCVCPPRFGAIRLGSFIAKGAGHLAWYT